MSFIIIIYEIVKVQCIISEMRQKFDFIAKQSFKTRLNILK